MEEKFDTYAYFWVSDFDCEAVEITNQMGLEPTEVILKGDVVKGDRLWKRSIWEFHSSLPRTEAFQDAHLSNLMCELLPRVQEIKKLSLRYATGISCVGYYTNVNSGFHMTADLVQQCGQLGLSIDFDLYTY